MTCNDCIYYEVCPLGLAIKGSTGTCLKFKNKADFVEVVRCKDCKYRYVYDEFDRDRDVIYKCSGCNMLHKDVDNTGFCSYGERKKNDKE